MIDHGRAAYTTGACACEVCRRAHTSYMADWRAQQQAVTGRQALRNGGRWSPADDAFLRAQRADGAPFEGIAIALGRTYHATVQRFHRLASNAYEALPLF